MQLPDKRVWCRGQIRHQFRYAERWIEDGARWTGILRARSGAADSGTAAGSYVETTGTTTYVYTDDKMVHELLTATGNPGKNGAVGFHFRDSEDPLVNTSLTAQVFLGTQIPAEVEAVPHIHCPLTLAQNVERQEKLPSLSRAELLRFQQPFEFQLEPIEMIWDSSECEVPIMDPLGNTGDYVLTIVTVEVVH